MNRIRKIKNIYQVLITPYNINDPGQEFILGNWNDASYGLFSVEIYNNFEQALYRSYKMPDINWDQIVLFHKDIYLYLKSVLEYIINKSELQVIFKSKLLNSHQLKNEMFDRILYLGDKFNTSYYFNDLISFNIIGSVKKMFNLLYYNQYLRINKYLIKGDVFKLIGTTDIGTSYEIILSPK